MAEVKFSKGSEEFVLFGQFYQLCQKHWKPEENQKYWDDLKESVDKFYKDNGCTDEAKHLGMALIYYLEEKYGKEKDKK